MGRFLEGLLATLRNTTDVEGPHGQLCTRFTNGLRCDDADGLAGVHDGTACKVTTVTHGTNALFRLTGQWGTDTRGGHTGFVDVVSHEFVDELAFFDQNLFCARTQNVFCGHTAQNPFCEGRNDLTIVNRRFRSDRVFSATVMHTHDAVLRHVNQTTGQVTGVRGL